MILRTYACADCGNFLEVELRADQWAEPPPDCPQCLMRGEWNPTHQEFKPPAIGGSVRSRAVKLAEDIASNDYNVADFKPDGREGGRPKVRYKDDAGTPPSTWAAPNAALAEAISLGRENRLRFGNGLDALQSNLKNGAQVDLIEASKRRSARVW